MVTFDEAPVYYTTDGTEPDSLSVRYTGVFVVDGERTVKAKAIREGNRESVVTEVVVKESDSRKINNFC